jgi:two-component system cell cycle sensor histidine kinase/response regulator CckA
MRGGWSRTSPRGHKTILFVEDDELCRITLFAVLQKSGYDTIVAVDGLDALSKAKEHKGEIDLLLSDILMPGMTGIELAKQLLVERPGTGILLISAIPQGRWQLEAGWQFLSKPFTTQILKRKIEGMLRERPERRSEFPMQT